SLDQLLGGGEKDKRPPRQPTCRLRDRRHQLLREALLGRSRKVVGQAQQRLLQEIKRTWQRQLAETRSAQADPRSEVLEGAVEAECRAGEDDAVAILEDGARQQRPHVERRSSDGAPAVAAKAGPRHLPPVR